MTDLMIMQGRLSPMVDGKIQAFPWEHWQDEFRIAAQIGIIGIDWIVETYRLQENPLLTESGQAQIKALQEETGVRIASVCADYFMENPLIRCSPQELRERLAVLEQLMQQVHTLKIPYIELPFVDNAAIQGEDDMRQLVTGLTPFLSVAEEMQITFALETSLNPNDFQDLLARFNHPRVKANYDSGNSAALGYDCREEFAEYGDQIVTVHIKDRVLGGTTVPLGTGNADFLAFLAGLDQLNYQGPLILQVARGDDDVKVIEDSRAFVREIRAGLTNLSA